MVQAMLIMTSQSYGNGHNSSPSKVTVKVVYTATHL